MAIKNNNDIRQNLSNKKRVAVNGHKEERN
jgi:hypothetical protein